LKKREREKVLEMIGVDWCEKKRERERGLKR